MKAQGYCRIEHWKDAVTQGHFYDLDMLEIGPMVWNGGKTRLTENEAIFAYTLRAFFLSPIQISCVVDQMTEFERDLVLNEEVIRINQDSLADFPELYSADEKEEMMVYRRMLEDGDTAFALFNVSEDYAGKWIQKHFGVNFSELLQEERCRIAAEYLKTTDMTVEEIMEKIGYNNGSFFRKLFDKYYHMSPKEYRGK